jgi:hypothetical protein
MSLMKNRHVLVALLIAPVLALIAWFALDLFVGEQPHAARPGQSYPLVELPNCRYDSGRCTLKNEDVVLELRAEAGSGGAWRITLESDFALDGVKLGLLPADGLEREPYDMQQADAEGLNWTAPLRFDDAETDRLRLVASARGTLFYGDAALLFTRPPEIP